jgi:hypothetical protein
MAFPIHRSTVKHMFSAIKNWHQTLSWKLGYGRGKEGRAYSCPW